MDCSQIQQGSDRHCFGVDSEPQIENARRKRKKSYLTMSDFWCDDNFCDILSCVLVDVP